MGPACARLSPAMAGRKIRDERDARVCWAAVLASGDDVRSWARAHDIDGRSLSAWGLNLGLKRPAKRKARTSRRALGHAQLVELVAAPMRPLTQGRYVIRVAGAELELDDNFREETLGRIVGVLRSC